MKLLKHYVANITHMKVWLSAQLMGRIEGSQTSVFCVVIDIAIVHYIADQVTLKVQATQIWVIFSIQI